MCVRLCVTCVLVVGMMSSSVLARRYAEAKAEVASLRNNVDVLRDHLQRVLQEYNSLFTAITGANVGVCSY